MDKRTIDDYIETARCNLDRIPYPEDFCEGRFEYDECKDLCMEMSYSIENLLYVIDKLRKDN